jgi:hypothetical protein
LSLVSQVGNDWANVRASAAEALSLITGEDFGQAAGRWQQWWDARP